MSENQSPNAGADGAAQGQPQQEFGLQKIYTKDISFEAPGTPGVFTREWKPETNVQLNSQARALDEKGVHEVELTLTVTTKSQGETAYLVEVKQAGVFMVRGIPDEQKGPLLSSYCPNILFPFAREVISDLVTRGGFPQLLLAPVNFDALYAQKMRGQQQAAAAGGNGDAGIVTQN
ncbi:preprotein translocase subunit SecB [Ectothiorhodospira haloalkaliphila]|uniref:Protein-export protein SecB n=1 Tax=Ectothiorhodospira haloalkaliphila TaxID=421628 RepID=W8KY52_9GAMM|nr:MULTISPECIES: protein-export chaperone SecB [Ectothiorhodospira]AHK80491.1 preprotein translocase subunit SecB [Ectothiorhodospira haloalkaliphila]MCG5494562.1 protein-export chaperone SecB [Ectothiorhodospira variabilis]MCG5496206.1 protein-export chaperone SecB [Ectothiorhodospira variabilis]MCG5503553.1 protein-export chaperone SecB [Ectothiorhodospira variabilis]MCG5506732.1 protein-export chaperone SecB [Ectothiorhodospira variabilis]